MTGMQRGEGRGWGQHMGMQEGRVGDAEVHLEMCLS